MIVQSRPASYFNAGITIIECCITCAIAMTTIALCVSYLGFTYKLQVKSEILLLHNVVRTLQQRAFATNKPYDLIFDLENRTYTYNGTKHTLPSCLQFGCVDGALGPPSHPIRPITQLCTFSDNTITIWPTGIVKSGSIYFTDQKKQFGYAFSNGIGTVSFLRVYEYNHTKWHSLL